MERNSNWRQHWNSSSLAKAEQQRLFTKKQSNFVINRQQAMFHLYWVITLRLMCFGFFGFFFSLLGFKGKLWLTSRFLFRFLIVFSKISWGSCGWLVAVFLAWCLFPSCLWSDFVYSLIKAGFHSASTFSLLIAAKNGPLHLPGYFILLDHLRLLWLEVKESSDWHYVVLMWCITDSLCP